MRFRFNANSIEELEQLDIDLENEENLKTIELIKKYWRKDINIYLEEKEQVIGLYDVYTEGGIWLGYLVEVEMTEEEKKRLEEFNKLTDNWLKTQKRKINKIKKKIRENKELTKKDLMFLGSHKIDLENLKKEVLKC